MERLKRIFAEGLSVSQYGGFHIHCERDIAYMLVNHIEHVLANKETTFVLSNRKKTFIATINYINTNRPYISKQSEGVYELHLNENTLRCILSNISDSQIDSNHFVVELGCDSNCGINDFYFSISNNISNFRFAR